jgi:hypothetical protein
MQHADRDVVDPSLVAPYELLEGGAVPRVSASDEDRILGVGGRAIGQGVGQNCRPGVGCHREFL